MAEILSTSALSRRAILPIPLSSIVRCAITEVKKLVEDMFLTLGEAEGVGLAAPQIGKNIRLFIVDCTPWGEDDPECADYKRAFINPEIYALSEEKKTYNEGCLSFPGIHARCV